MKMGRFNDKYWSLNFVVGGKLNIKCVFTFEK